MFVVLWESVPQRGKKGSDLCNIHHVLNIFVGHVSAGDGKRILISSMCSSVPVPVQVGGVQVSSFDRIFKGTFCTCSSDTFPPQSVSQV